MTSGEPEKPWEDMTTAERMRSLGLPVPRPDKDQEQQ